MIVAVRGLVTAKSNNSRKRHVLILNSDTHRTVHFQYYNIISPGCVRIYVQVILCEYIMNAFNSYTDFQIYK